METTVPGLHRAFEADLISFIANEVGKALDSDSSNEVMVARAVRKRIADLDAATRKTIVTELAAAHAAGLTTATAAEVTAHAGLAALTREVTGAVTGTHLRALRTATDTYRLAVAKGAAEAVSTNVTRRAAAQGVLTDLGKKGITGYIDKSGRSWSLDSYVETAMRSAVARSQVNGQVAGIADRGNDLVIVSVSPAGCGLCDEFEGEVLSISGDSTEYGSLDDAESEGLFHPGCTHSVSMYQEGVTEKPEVEANPEGYADRQKLRQLERGVRQSKRMDAAAITPEAQAKAKARTSAYQAKIRDHVANTDQQRQYGREQIGRAR